MKRAFDLVCASAMLLLLSPVLLIIAALIKKGDGGAVFYRGVRAGRHGVPFRMFKFRTMVMDADRLGGSSTSDIDPRITRIGAWLRRYKLDELPQLLNVVRGEMSLVGPRPEVLEYVALYRLEERTILNVRPGLTDWASLWNSDEGHVLSVSADPDRDYVEKIRPVKLRLQLKYVRESSFFADLRILVLTLGAVAFGLRAPIDAPDPMDLVTGRVKP